MRHIKIFVLSILLALLFQPGYAEDTKLWYEQPAEEWTEGLPLGNGRLMATVQGGVQSERIQLNDDTVWTGRPVQRDNPGGAAYLPLVRELMFEGKYAEAHSARCAAIAEMMLQSHAGEIHLLPAAPSALPDGEVTGLRARRGFEVDLVWSNGNLETVVIKSHLGGPCRLKCGERRIEFETVAGEEYRFNADLFLLQTR